MNFSRWLLGGVGMAGVAGFVFLAAGFFQPGRSIFETSPEGSRRPLLAEAKKKIEAIRKAQEGAAKSAQDLTGLKGNEGEHRVFVSSQLVYLPENTEPVQPLDRTMRTADGIEVGWKIRHGFDPADPALKEEDPDGDGFTNLEEFLAQTDPTRKEDSPAKESKLKSRSPEPVSMAVSFPEKSGGLYSIRFQVGAKRREFKGKPKDTFWVMAGPDALEVFTSEEKMKAARAKARESGQNSHVIPIQFLSYEEKIEKVRDAKAGGVEVEVDNSVVVLERLDALQGRVKLVFSVPQRPQTLFWDVGDIRFFTPASGGTELGPFRLGETFSYEGKEFALVGREDKKIQIRNLGEPGKPDFWVPAETLTSPRPDPGPGEG